jgi:ribosomal 30S subunit maturation factor RimM
LRIFPQYYKERITILNCGLSVINENEIKSGIITVILETGVNDVCISRENSEKGNFLPIFPSVLQGANLELVNVHPASGSTDHYGC